MQYSVLKNRILFYDGTSVIEPTEVPNALLDGVPIESIAVTELNSEIESITEFEMEDIELVGYESHDAIKAPMAC